MNKRKQKDKTSLLSWCRLCLLILKESRTYPCGGIECRVGVRFAGVLQHHPEQQAGHSPPLELGLGPAPGVCHALRGPAALHRRHALHWPQRVERLEPPAEHFL